jgi:hypothetical protein
MNELPAAKISVARITMAEPTLQGVKQDDGLLVRSIIYILHACRHPDSRRVPERLRLPVSWNVTNTYNGYEISGLVEPNKDFEIYKEDLDLIHATDPLRVRVQSISVRRTGDAPQLLMRVLSQGEPVMITELEVINGAKEAQAALFLGCQLFCKARRPGTLGCTT